MFLIRELKHASTGSEVVMAFGLQSKSVFICFSVIKILLVEIGVDGLATMRQECVVVVVGRVDVM